MAHIVTINDFSGPLDLLLQLVVEKKKDITEISLAEVTDKYLAYITQEGDRIDPADIADFLLVASRLLYIKSRILMPHLLVDEDEDETNLVDQLRLYKEFSGAARKINKIYSSGAVVCPNDVPPHVIETKFRPADNLNQSALSNALVRLIDTLRPIIKIPKALIEKTITLHQKITALKELLSQQMKLSFHSHVAMGDVRDKVISFIAVLELVKQQIVHVEQHGLFADIIITRRD